MAMHDPVQKAALWEQATHPYRNRTWRLNNSTKADVAYQSDQAVQVDLLMGSAEAYYAPFIVYEKGLSNIYSAAMKAETGIESKLDKLAARIAGRG